MDTKAQESKGTIRVGELSKRISIYRKMMADDGMGGKEDADPQLIANVWAKVLKPKFWTGNSSGPATAITQGFLIRNRDDVGYDCYVMYKKIPHKILHIDQSSAIAITLTCQAVITRG
jgi:hypothetical protein